MVDTRLQRKNMVEGQVRPSDITDRRITAAMSEIPRESFIPPTFASLAYSDEALEFGPGNFLVAPRTLAKLIQLAAIDNEDSVLVIGGSCGYAAAIVANLARKVVALLPDPDRAAAVQSILAGLGLSNIETHAGRLQDGRAATAPYQAIVIEGAIEAVPKNLQSQLALGGRLVAIERRNGVDRGLVALRISNGYDQRTMFELAAPELPGFAAERASFVF